MRIATRTVVEGVTVPAEQVKTIFEMVEMVYKTLTTAGTISPDQLKAYEDLAAIMPEI